MPYKDHSKNLECARTFGRSPFGKFQKAKSHAKDRNIDWNLTFEEWWKIWQDSGYWEERGRPGYCMCRKGDEGSYSVDNVYIDTFSNNGKASHVNGKNPRKLTDEQFKQLMKDVKNYYPGVVVEVAKKYGVDPTYVSYIRLGNSKRALRLCLSQ